MIYSCSDLVGGQGGLLFYINTKVYICTTDKMKIVKDIKEPILHCVSVKGFSE